MNKKTVLIVFAIISFLGFLDAAYLTALHYLGSIVPCVITSGCETVTTSVYSKIAGIPVALFGALYYLILFILSLYVLENDKEIIYRKVFPVITGFGFIFTLWLLYVQTFILNAFCSYCLFSAITTTLLLISAIFLRRTKPEIPQNI